MSAIDLRCDDERRDLAQIIEDACSAADIR